MLRKRGIISGIAGLALLASSPAVADVQITFWQEAAIADTSQAKIVLENRLRKAFEFLYTETDYSLDLDKENAYISVEYFSLPGLPVIPISYDPADSTIRISSEFAEPISDRTRNYFLSILSSKQSSDVAETDSILEDFMVQEFVHELTHDWQNRVGGKIDELPVLLREKGYWQDHYGQNKNPLARAIGKLLDAYISKVRENDN